MRDRKQIREAIEGVTAETGGWDSPPTWSQIGDVLAVLLAPAQEPIRGTMTREEHLNRYGFVPAGYVGPEEPAQAGGEAGSEPRPMLTEWTDGADDDGHTYSHRGFADGREGLAVHANSRGRWIVWHAGKRAAQGEVAGTNNADRLASAKRAADEAAAKWYRLPAPGPVPGDAAPDGFDANGNPELSIPCRVRALLYCVETGAMEDAGNHIAELAELVPPSPGFVPPQLRGAPAPAALRERAIRAMAEAGGVPESVVRAAAGEEGIVKREVDAVERALRDEYQRGQGSNRPAARIAFTADQLRAMTNSDEHGDKVIVTTAGELRALLLDETRDAEVAKPRPTNAPPATVAEAVAWLDDVLQRAGTRRDVHDGLTKVRALLAGPLAGIVEAHRAREAFAEHAMACPQMHSFNGGCEFGKHGNMVPGEDCPDGQRLAAAVGGAR